MSSGEEIYVNGDEGLEPEGEDSLEFEHPFNPEEIRVRSSSYVVSLIVARIDHDEIDLAPDFQRNKGVWKPKEKSRLIESFLLRIPIPIFYVSANDDEKWSVVDGIQRLSTIDDYIKGQFALKNLEYLTQYENKSFDELPRPMQRRINETQLVINVIESTTPEEVKFNIFKRINTGGSPLNGQEVRHALHPGYVREYLRKLADSEEFKRATDGSIKPLRMQDRECVLRFLAFYINPWEQYSGKDFNGFLGGTMKEINKIYRDDPAELEEIEGHFRKTMQSAFDIFGDNAFRKPKVEGKNRATINRALFDSWSIALARLNNEEIARLIENKENMENRFGQLMEENEEFNHAISVATSNPDRIKIRFGAIENLVRGVLEC